ncbi:MAG: M20 family metallopeptidase, partial [Atribacterota bacterium]|nr:M20 family metallopeptidase [Atribacterota bacterium]
MEIKKKISLLKDEIISLRRDFHAHPELGWNEFKTSEKIVKYLENIGLDVKEVARPGVVGLLKGKKEGPTLMMRADMDALPIQEMNEISYKSLNNGVMHACGHDGHMAMQLVTAKILSEYKEELEGNIKFVFQPNEETAEGAKEMIKEGVLENPKVDAAIGMHLWSQLDSGLVGLKTGAVMASLAYLKVKVTGKGGHTGYPEQAIDPIIAAADIVQKIQILQTREKSQLDPTIIVFGKITAGSKNNIIPESVELEGTIRKLELIENQSNYNLEKRLKELLFSFEQSHRVRIDLDL